MAKYGLLRETLARDPRFTFEPAPMALIKTVELAHDTSYIQGFLRGELSPKVIRRIGFPWSEDLVRRTLASTGGTLAAAHDALEFRWGGTLAGGTHHAFRDAGAGFCVFNDIAVAIRALQTEGRVRKVSVVDLDVHQGDGTAVIFADDPNVFTLSLHGRDNFPFRKQTSRMDVPLADGTTDREYLEALAEVLPIAFEWKPDIVFYQSGVDALSSDSLGRLALTHRGLQQRDEMVFTACVDADVPCTVMLGGGYSQPVTLTVEAHANTFRAAADAFNGSYSKPTVTGSYSK